MSDTCPTLCRRNIHVNLLQLQGNNLAGTDVSRECVSVMSHATFPFIRQSTETMIGLKPLFTMSSAITSSVGTLPHLRSGSLRGYSLSLHLEEVMWTRYVSTTCGP